MASPEVYHSLGYRAALLRQEKYQLDTQLYLQQWFGKMSVGIQLGDFFQPRPTARRSLCEWIEDPDKDAPLPVDDPSNLVAGEDEAEDKPAGGLSICPIRVWVCVRVVVCN